MVTLRITRKDLQFLILAASTERKRSEEVGVPLCRYELDCLAKLYRARDKAYASSPEVTSEWQRELAAAPTPLEERRILM